MQGFHIERIRKEEIMIYLLIILYLFLMFASLCYLYYFDESRCSDFTWKGFFATIIIAILWPMSCLIVLYYVLKNGSKLIKIKRKENYYGKKMKMRRRYNGLKESEQLIFIKCIIYCFITLKIFQRMQMP